jgi:hypothetical protein
MTYKNQQRLEAAAYTPRTACQADDYIYIGWELPCDVMLPPNTVITAGCSLSTLIAALELPNRPTNFAQGIEAASAAETPKSGSVHESPVAKPCAQ